jgi:CRP/FNR family transcriptional regulator, cyclic AMP receptor protein
MDKETVSSIPLDDLMKGSQGEIARLADELEVTAGTELTKQGEYAREFFIILDGAAEVVRDGERVATLGPGDFFGEVGLLSSTGRVAAVIALTPMRLLVIAPREFQTMLRNLPSIAERVQRAAVERR